MTGCRCRRLRPVIRHLNAHVYKTGRHTQFSGSEGFLALGPHLKPANHLPVEHCRAMALERQSDRPCEADLSGASV